MIYAKVENSAVTDYPYDMYKLRSDNPNTSFPKDSLEQEDIRSSFNVVELSSSEKPSEDTQHVKEGTPVFSNGVWTQVWETSLRTAGELTELAIHNRLGEYGIPVEQLEFITENGLEAWQTKVAEIKAKYPKT